jgi:hypothetical protein
MALISFTIRSRHVMEFSARTGVEERMHQRAITATLKIEPIMVRVRFTEEGADQE